MILDLMAALCLAPEECTAGAFCPTMSLPYETLPTIIQAVSVLADIGWPRLSANAPVPHSRAPSRSQSPSSPPSREWSPSSITSRAQTPSTPRFQAQTPSQPLTPTPPAEPPSMVRQNSQQSSPSPTPTAALTLSPLANSLPSDLGWMVTEDNYPGKRTREEDVGIWMLMRGWGRGRLIPGKGA